MEERLVIVKGEVKIPIEYKINKADRFWRRLRGLMFRREPLQQEGLWIVPCHSIHMFFMYFAIDVVFIDKQNQIVKLAENVQPRSVIGPVASAYSVLELPVGTIEKFNFEIGDRVVLNSKEDVRIL